MSTEPPAFFPRRLRGPFSTAVQTAIPVVAVALLLTACSTPPAAEPDRAPVGGVTAAPADDASDAPASSTPSASAEPHASARPRPSTPRPSPSTTTKPVTACDPVILDLVLGPADSSAGSIDQPIVLSNRGHVPCTVSGAPYVHMIGADWNPLGPDATGSGAPTPLVRLESGGSATAIVRIVHVGDDGGPLGDRCTPAPGVALLVETADQRRGDPLDGEFRGCTEPDVSTMSVTGWRLGA